MIACTLYDNNVYPLFIPEISFNLITSDFIACDFDQVYMYISSERRPFLTMFSEANRAFTAASLLTSSCFPFVESLFCTKNYSLSKKSVKTKRMVFWL